MQIEKSVPPFKNLGSPSVASEIYNWLYFVDVIYISISCKASS